MPGHDGDAAVRAEAWELEAHKMDGWMALAPTTEQVRNNVTWRWAAGIAIALAAAMVIRGNWQPAEASRRDVGMHGRLQIVR